LKPRRRRRGFLLGAIQVGMGCRYSKNKLN
jgi:hypothetical protein